MDRREFLIGGVFGGFLAAAGGLTALRDNDRRHIPPKKTTTTSGPTTTQQATTTTAAPTTAPATTAPTTGTTAPATTTTTAQPAAVFGPRVAPGITPGTTLRQVTNYTPAAGETVTGLDILQPVTSSGDGATFINCRLRSGLIITGPAHVTLRNCQLGMPDGSTTNLYGIALAHHNWQAYACDILGFGDGARIAGGAQLLEDCRIRLWGRAGDHNDGVQAYGPGETATAVIRHCDINGTAVNGAGGANAALFWADNTLGTCLIENNLLTGGGYTLRCHDSGRFTVRHNRWRDGTWAYGPALTTGGTILEWTDNQTLAGVPVRP